MFRGSFIANDDVCHAAIAISIMMITMLTMMMMMICAQGDRRPGRTQRCVNQNTHAGSNNNDRAYKKGQQQQQPTIERSRQRDRTSAHLGTERNDTKRNGSYAPCREQSPSVASRRVVVGVSQLNVRSCNWQINFKPIIKKTTTKNEQRTQAATLAATATSTRLAALPSPFQLLQVRALRR